MVNCRNRIHVIIVVKGYNKNVTKTFRPKLAPQRVIGFKLLLYQTSSHHFPLLTMADPRVNQIRIKTGVLKRLAKEKVAYEKELERENQRLETMKAANKDEHELNKQEEVINETIMLLPDCQRRINAAYDDLQKLVKESEFDLNENEIYITAKSLLQEVDISA